MKLFTGTTKKAGHPPGTLISMESGNSGPVVITAIEYSLDKYSEIEIPDFKAVQASVRKDSVLWLNVDGVHDPEIINHLGGIFGIHPLVQEDIMNTGSRPKLEDYDDLLFIIFKMLYLDAKTGKIEAEQVSLVVKKNIVISFQEKKGDVFEPLRQRLRKAKGNVRKKSADYLAYALLDSVVDNYFIVPEIFSGKIETFEESIVSDPAPEMIHSIHKMKQDILYLRKLVWPMREVVNALARGDAPLIKKETTVFFRDVYDHSVQVIETIETFRDVLTGLQDTYMTSMSNRLNEVMKTLTIISTVFIPLTFIAGVYGMNFENMPELSWKNGYFFVLLVMAVIVVIMFIFFRRKKWL